MTGPSRPKRTRLRRGARPKSPHLTEAALVDVQEKIGYVFKDRSILDRAMTHASALTGPYAQGSSYQRLEFLGDRVLGLVIAERIFERRPTEAEGRLAVRLNRFVNKSACAQAVQEIGLAPYILLGPSEQRNGGYHNINILGDVCEAVIAALYLDNGLKPARNFIERAWATQFKALPEELRDAKSQLQEWAQAKGYATPVYQMRDRSGPDHAPRFTVEVILDRYHRADASGPSKQAAERAAANTLLKQLKVT